MIERILLVIRHSRWLWRQLALPKNRAKGTWKNLTSYELLQLARLELDELVTACWEVEAGRGSAARIAEEAGDLSAFAAMIADNARSEERHGRICREISQR